MQNHSSRAYSYDDQNVNYQSSGDSHVPQNYPYSSQAYTREPYANQQSSYYLPNQGANVNTHASAADPRHYRPATSHGHRPSRSVADPRYYNSSMVSQSSSSQQPSSLTSYYGGSSSQYSSGPTDRYIPTPSDLASNQYEYSTQQMSQSPTMYSTPGHHQRQHRQPSTSPILTSRPSHASRTLHSQGAPVSPTTERYLCEICGKTFSRSHDRKRHHETQHIPSPVLHKCRYCRKEFSRADSLKRHLDNGCDEAPSSSR
ncbi:hypothetical protein K435DRAFT_965813 [Dendrothele bispora CBS 962.96]|uniref:C2H2-type domain-containing protein n=1 Tax=Dendrothele bispora (strain CBS 962.96) TaxID=1314807 RepID=A0A4S8M3J7_DENBC|nr:hypothetical protein K435DRAFT_965813 [Dendrothele bispora CBS 962.96]